MTEEETISPKKNIVSGASCADSLCFTVRSLAFLWFEERGRQVGIPAIYAKVTGNSGLRSIETGYSLLPASR